MRSGSGDAADAKRAEDEAAARGDVIGQGDAARIGTRTGIKVYNWATGGGGGAPDCVPGEDPSDPECDGVQVVTGARICKPGEDAAKTGCVPDSGSAHRGAPATGAFPSQALETDESRAEAQRTREAQARFIAQEQAEKDGAGTVALVLGAVVAAGGAAAGVWYLTKRKKKRRKLWRRRRSIFRRATRTALPR